MGASFRLWMISSMIPYSRASSAVRILSRSMSCRTCSGVLPLCLASVASSSLRMREISAAWISRSDTLAVDALGGRLVDEDPGVRHREALAGRARGEQHRRGRGGLPEADRGDLRAD